MREQQLHEHVHACQTGYVECTKPYDITDELELSQFCLAMQSNNMHILHQGI